MSAAPRALLLVWTDIAAELEAEFNDWYNREHVRERVAVAGFIRGRRYAALEGSPKYLALYEARDAAVLRSDAYLAIKRKRDTHSLRFVNAFRNTIKATCDVHAHAGAGEGAFLVLLPVVSQTVPAQAALQSLCDALVQEPGIVAASFAAANADARASSAPFDARAGDRHLQSVIMVEAAGGAGAQRAHDRLNAQTLRGPGMTPALFDKPFIFRSLYTLHHSQE